MLINNIIFEHKIMKIAFEKTKITKLVYIKAKQIVTIWYRKKKDSN